MQSPSDLRMSLPSPTPSVRYGTSLIDNELGRPPPSPVPLGLTEADLKPYQTAVSRKGECEISKGRRPDPQLRRDVAAWINGNNQNPPIYGGSQQPGINGIDRQPLDRIPDIDPSSFIIIPCFDVRRARLFYSKCFGWTFLNDISIPSSDDYALRHDNLRRYGSAPHDTMSFFTSDQPFGNQRITGALLQHTDPLRKRYKDVEEAMSYGKATTYFRVPDIGETADRIEGNYGEIGWLRVGTRGYTMDIAEFLDSEGNLFGLIAYHPGCLST